MTAITHCVFVLCGEALWCVFLCKARATEPWPSRKDSIHRNRTGESCDGDDQDDGDDALLNARKYIQSWWVQAPWAQARRYKL